MINLIGFGIFCGDSCFPAVPPFIPLSNYDSPISLILLDGGPDGTRRPARPLGHLMNAAGWIYFIVMFSYAGQGIFEALGASFGPDGWPARICFAFLSGIDLGLCSS